MNFLFHFYQDPGNEENLKKLKTSYETLVKFSFLAQDDEQFTNSLARESRDQLHNLYLSTKLNNNSSTNGNNILNKKSTKTSDKLQSRRNLFKESKKNTQCSIAEDEENQMGKTAMQEDQDEY